MMLTYVMVICHECIAYVIVYVMGKVSWWYVISVITDVMEVCHVVNVMVTCHGYILYVIEVCHGVWCHGDISLVHVMWL